MSDWVSNMESGGEFELRDEELVDFEGSDYSIGFDDEFGEEEVGGPLSSSKVENIIHKQIEHVEQSERRIRYPFSRDQINAVVCSTTERAEIEAANSAANITDWRQSCSREGAESGEIEEEKNVIEDGGVSQNASSFESKNLEDGAWHGRDRKHLRADLEDGELDDAAMPEAFNYEGEGNMDSYRMGDECIGQERKRRNFEYLAECQTDIKGRESMEAQSMASIMVQNRSRGRYSDHSRNFSKCKPGARGYKRHIFGRTHANLQPGVMAPTRPWMPRDFGGPLNPFGVHLGMSTPIQFQEALMQEQIMMSNHALHLGATGLGHPSFNMDFPSPRPFGMDYFGVRPRGMMHIRPPINYLGPFDHTIRGQAPCFGIGRNLGRGLCANIGSRGGSFTRNGFGRPSAWPLNPVEMAAVERGRVRHHPVPIPSGHDQSRNTQESQFRAERLVTLGQEVPNVDVNNGDKIKQEESKKWYPVNGENIACSKNTNGAQHQSNVEKEENNELHSDSNYFERNHSSIMTKTSTEDNGETPVSRVLQVSTSSSQEVGSGAANVIKLGGPVQRSRVLSVGGLPEGTPLSIVIETFEKQGKIMDVKKEDKGDVFTITFSTLLEAVSAKRLLHRSILGGKQITVDYSL